MLVCPSVISPSGSHFSKILEKLVSDFRYLEEVDLAHARTHPHRDARAHMLVLHHGSKQSEIETSNDPTTLNRGNE